MPASQCPYQFFSSGGMNGSLDRVRVNLEDIMVLVLYSTPDAPCHLLHILNMNPKSHILARMTPQIKTDSRGEKTTDRTPRGPSPTRGVPRAWQPGHASDWNR